MRWLVGGSYTTLNSQMQTYTRLQKLLYSLSHKRTISCLDTLGVDFDAKVKGWQDNLTQTLMVSW